MCHIGSSLESGMRYGTQLTAEHLTHVLVLNKDEVGVAGGGTAAGAMGRRWPGCQLRAPRPRGRRGRFTCGPEAAGVWGW